MLRRVAKRGMWSLLWTSSEGYLQITQITQMIPPYLLVAGRQARSVRFTYP